MIQKIYWNWMARCMKYIVRSTPPGISTDRKEDILTWLRSKA
jgi:hypothetical protein